MKRYYFTTVMCTTITTFFLLTGLAFAQEWATSGNNIYNTNSGNVGIGTTSPANKLEVRNGSTFVSSPFEIGNNAPVDNSGLRTWNTLSFYSSCCGFTTPANPGIQFNPRNGSGWFKGRLGIGTTGPLRQTHIRGAGQASETLSDSGNTGATLYVQDSGGLANNGGAILFGASQGFFAAIKGMLTDGNNNTVGDINIQTRNSYTDTSLTSRLYQAATSASERQLRQITN